MLDHREETKWTSIESYKAACLGKIAIGMGLHQSRTTDIGGIAKACNYDWLFIDMEHSALDIGTASQIASRRCPSASPRSFACPARSITTVAPARTGRAGHRRAARDSVEEARRAVSYCNVPADRPPLAVGQQPQFASSRCRCGAEHVSRTTRPSW